MPTKAQQRRAFGKADAHRGTTKRTAKRAVHSDGAARTQRSVSARRAGARVSRPGNGGSSEVGFAERSERRAGPEREVRTERSARSERTASAGRRPERGVSAERNGRPERAVSAELGGSPERGVSKRAGARGRESERSVSAELGGGPRVAALLAELRGMGSERDREGMARYGINVENAFGVSVTALRKVAKRIGTDHELALALWVTGNHEARLLACFIDDPEAVTAEQMDAWAADLDSWDVCDQATTSLFDRTPHAWKKAREFAKRDELWIKRAGFSLMAGLARHDTAAPDSAFVGVLPLIERGAFDERNFVKKAVSWALRGIGKRNRPLNEAAVACAERILAAANERAGNERGGDPATRAARWVATDALKELTSKQVRARLDPKPRRAR